LSPLKTEDKKGAQDEEEDKNSESLSWQTSGWRLSGTDADLCLGGIGIESPARS
jgi:hypothetical protein